MARGAARGHRRRNVDPHAVRRFEAREGVSKTAADLKNALTPRYEEPQIGGVGLMKGGIARRPFINARGQPIEQTAHFLLPLGQGPRRHGKRRATLDEQRPHQIPSSDRQGYGIAAPAGARVTAAPSAGVISPVAPSAARANTRTRVARAVAQTP